jgi:hypothetical protein
MRKYLFPNADFSHGGKMKALWKGEIAGKF